MFQEATYLLKEKWLSLELSPRKFNAFNHQFLVVFFGYPTSFADNSRLQGRRLLLSIMSLPCSLDLLHMHRIPVAPDDTIYEQFVSGPWACHCIFNEHGITHRSIGSCADLVKEGILDMRKGVAEECLVQGQRDEARTAVDNLHV